MRNKAGVVCLGWVASALSPSLRAAPLSLPDLCARHALLRAMRGHVLAERELIGTFQAPQ